jgi:hypothetical protein
MGNKWRIRFHFLFFQDVIENTGVTAAFQDRIENKGVRR